MSEVLYETRVLAQKIADKVHEYGHAVKRDELFSLVGAKKGDKAVHAAIDYALLESMLLRRDALYCSPRQAGRVRGRLQRSTRGFGFVGDKLGDDLFIPPNAMAGAMNGDIVLCTILPPKMNGKGPEGRIEKIVERKTKYVVGIVDLKGRAPRLQPDEMKLCDPIYIDKRFLNGAQHGPLVRGGEVDGGEALVDGLADGILLFHRDQPLSIGDVSFDGVQSGRSPSSRRSLSCAC